jgi:hypothetical protein
VLGKKSPAREGLGLLPDEEERAKFTRGGSDATREE